MVGRLLRTRALMCHPDTGGCTHECVRGFFFFFLIFLLGLPFQLRGLECDKLVEWKEGRRDCICVGMYMESWRMPVGASALNSDAARRACVS